MGVGTECPACVNGTLDFPSANVGNICLARLQRGDHGLVVCAIVGTLLFQTPSADPSLLACVCCQTSCV